MSLRVRRTAWLIAMLTLVVSLSGPAAWAVSAQDEPAEPENAEELTELSGDIVVDGSSTVFPVTAAAAEEFEQYAPDVRTSVGISGTGGGFEKFCRGETDIQDASRPIVPDEVAACEENGVEYIELPVAFDGLTVVANPENDFVDCLTVEELNMIWRPESEGEITNWNQVREDFPDRSLNLYGAGTDSGTFDYFTQAINGEEGASRGDYQASEDDNILVQGVSGDADALGYFGYAYYVENQDALKVIAVDNGDGCVAPSAETVNDGSYQPLSRPIFIYVNAEAAERPEVQGFVDYYLSDAFTPIIDTPEVGYIELPDELYAAITERFDTRTTGTLFPEGSEVGATLDRYLEDGSGSEATPES